MNDLFKALILTQRTAPVELRESVALDRPAAEALIALVQELTGASDLLVLSTCNRTEIYYSSPADLSTTILQALRLIKPAAEDARVQAAFTPLLEQSQAVRHLFRVSLGLEAQVPGDMQIIAQVKEAYQLSADRGVAGPFLHRLLHTIFFCNKRVTQETSFRTGAASVAFVAQELAEDLLPRGLASRVLVLGTGEMGTNLAGNLADAGYRQVTILNRTLEKACALAEAHGFEAAPLDELEARLPQTDLVISCLSAPAPVLTPALMAGLHRTQRLVVFDLSVPRSVDPAVEGHRGVLLYNIDEIQARAGKALEARLSEVPRVEAMMEESLLEFVDWSREMLVGPALQRFKQALEELRRQEVAKALRTLSEEQRQAVEQVTQALVQKIVKLPALELKAACRRGEAESLAEHLHVLFQLDHISALTGE